MTSFRARIREIAEDVAKAFIPNDAVGNALLKAAVDESIKLAIEELLAREPSEGMISAGMEAPAYGHPETATPTYRDVYKCMSAQFLKECRDE